MGKIRRSVLLFGCLLLASVAAGQPAGPPVSPAPEQPVAPDTRSSTALRDAVETATTTDPPATLRLSNRDVAVFRATILLRTPAVRATGATRMLEELVDDASPGVVRSRALAGGELISVGTRDVFALVPGDLDPAGEETLAEVAQHAVTRLQQALDEAVEFRTPGRLLQSGVLALIATIAFVVLLGLLVRGHRSFVAASTRAADRQLHRIPGAEVMRTARLPKFLRYLVTVASVGVGAVLTYSWLTFVLRRFPYTRPWGETLRGFLLQELATMGTSILEALPSLFTVALIVLITRLLVKLAGLVFEAVEQGRATVPWVYPETAAPTRRLVAGFLWLFALALAYPYLPGSDTDAFKGVSVFVGLMISLGSSGIVNQMMSGLTLTYSRALRQGDFVRIGDLEGTVTHLGGLSIKLKTPRREEITIPNTVVVSTETTNYSRFSDSEGVFAATSVTIGYDTPWRQVEALLLIAANRTPGVRKQPPPAVRQTALRDFYVEYTLLVCLADPASRGPTLDRLHGHIQDAFNEHGVQIMSPNYEADPAGPKIVPPERWHVAPALATQSSGD
jgi:small-conductance mechanosensitive channel